MNKAAIVILAGTEGHENMARVTNALQAAKEFKEEGDDLELIFDGAGTQWIEKLEDEDHDLHEVYSSVSENSKACSFCVSAFDADVGDVEKSDENDGHPSFRELVDEGYEVITF
ncbi:MAG: DsrE family protein [Candidatus Nanohaloarchaea archaeon]